ncbi:MAG TPA: polyprenyl synthetase family protein [Thermoanaerobaculia bacterium]|nr:polyprenyl synthetase family protein [Thermoanaerobaculia bacterium]
MTRRRGPDGSFATFSELHIGRLEERLSAVVPADDSPLSSAMRAALLSPGKRIRALVALAAGVLFRGDPAGLLDFGAALEAVHAASLVFDDLPSMDDATLRRGRPALHLEFGESTAILAAVALINRAFELLGRSDGLPDRIRTKLVAELARAAGEPGCCRGQFADLTADPARATLDELERIHALKTGELFVAAARGGAIAARASEEGVAALTRYAKNLGLAFQIVDDLLETPDAAERTGKKAHGEGHRANFAKILGRETAVTIAGELTEAAASAVEPLGPRGRPLADLAYLLRDRRS